jgi:hypothetical protein
MRRILLQGRDLTVSSYAADGYLGLVVEVVGAVLVLSLDALTTRWP